MIPKIECFCQASNILGEGPIYYSEEDSLYWVDIEAGEILAQALQGGDLRRWKVNERCGFIVPDENNQWLAGLQSGLYYLSLGADGRVEREAFDTANHHEEDIRLNDGTRGPDGRIWCGDMHLGCTKPRGRIYRYPSIGEPQVIAEGFVVSNGPAFSHDGLYIYYNETVGSKRRPQGVYRAQITPEGAKAECLFIDYRERNGSPDGMAVDRYGLLWVAEWGGFGLTAFDAEGKAIQRIDLPFPYVTKPAFGGKHSDILFVTSARLGMDKEMLAKYPLAGSVFRIDGLLSPSL